MFGLVAAIGGGVAAYFGAEGPKPGEEVEKKVLELGDLLPWWLATALVVVIALSALLKAVVGYSEDPDDGKAVALASGILSPIFSMVAASLSFGVVAGWVTHALIKQTDPTPAWALLGGVGFVVLAGLVLLGVANSRWKPALHAYHRRLNPKAGSENTEQSGGASAQEEPDLASA